MRSIVRIAALILVLIALMVPLMTHASDGGPCPDDPELSLTCAQTAPPYYVVVNRSVEYLPWDRPGTGCQPFILANPNCKDCATPDASCAAIDVEAKLCQPYLRAATGTTETVYEMCCNCATNPAGDWVYRIRTLDDQGNCPITSEGWQRGLPPNTGIDLPVPVIVGGLALIGAGLLAAGMLVRRRTLRTA
ncbi:MAG: hypothetical protein PVG56_15580 [Anaerolineae bacterium]|jgi:hypothetical protein